MDANMSQNDQPMTPEERSAPQPRNTTSGTVDLEAVKARQRATWESGDYCQVGSKLVIVSELLCEAADVRTGSEVLDVACGHGNTAIAAARRGAVATGLDYVPSLLERARERAAAERLQVEWREGDAENLPFEDGRFDTVLSTFGVMFAPDQRRAAGELLRVCRPGGKVALACWTPDSLAGEMFRTIGRFAPPPPGLKSPMVWGTREGVSDLLGDGTRGVTIERRQFVQRYASAEHWLEVFRNWFGPVRRAFEALEPPAQEDLSRELIALFRRHDRSGGESLVAPIDYLEIVALRA